MTMKIRKRWFIALGGAAAVAGLLFHYKERDSYRCQICWSRMDRLQWRLGLWGSFSVPLTPSWERITETRFFHDFLSSGHAHAWKFAQGSPYHFFGTTWGGCAIGSGRHVSELCQMYESSPKFRAFISRGLDDGALTRSNVLAMMSYPRLTEPSLIQKEADALLETFFAR
jgi:hypothetical protein